MKNKFGRAAVVAAAVLMVNYFLSSLLNEFIITRIYGAMVSEFSGMGPIYVIYAIFALESAITMFLVLIIGGKWIYKKNIKATQCIVPALLAAVESVVTFYIPNAPQLICFIVDFACYFAAALVAEKLLEKVDDVSESEPVQEVKKEKTKVVANEDLTNRAQFAFNKKLEEIKASAVEVDDMVEAKLFAQAVELQLLKTPATAQFCALDEMTVTVNDDIYVVRGYVDSQNSYGAMVRTPFTITVFKENGVWKNADKIISTSAIVGGTMISHTILWWILGIIGSIISFLIYYYVISSRLGL